MFNHKTQAVWQGIAPDSSLRDRVLHQAAQDKKVVPFPAKAIRSAITAAACIVVAVMLLNPSPQVTLVGTGPGIAMAAYSRQMPAQQGMTLTLETNRNTILSTEDGWVEQDGKNALWHLPGEGEFTLTAVNGKRSTEFSVAVTITDEGRSVTVK